MAQITPTLHVTWSLFDGRMDSLHRITAPPTLSGRFTEDARNVTTHQNQSGDPEPRNASQLLRHDP